MILYSSYEISDLYEWAYDELARGNRIKASKIMKVAEQMKLRNELWHKD